MKRFLFLTIALFALSFTSFAQDDEDNRNQPFRFIYIVHDGTTPVERLIEKLYEVETITLENNQKCMICMSNGRSAKPGEEYLHVVIQEGNDYKQYFEKLRAELRNKPSHDFDISRDVEYIVNIFNREHDFLDEYGELFYKSMTFDFYLSPKFCDNGYASKLITPLYLAFDVPNMPNHFNFNVWVGAAHREGYDYSPERILGNKNYNDINENLMIMDF